VVPQVNGQNIRFLVIQPLYKVEKEGDRFIKEQYLKVWMNKNDISAFGEYIGSKGQVVKSRSRIYNRVTSNYSNVAHTIKELEEILMPSKIGFK
jgi:hypothetical protein